MFRFDQAVVSVQLFISLCISIKVRNTSYKSFLKRGAKSLFPTSSQGLGQAYELGKEDWTAWLHRKPGVSRRVRSPRRSELWAGLSTNLSGEQWLQQLWIPHPHVPEPQPLWERDHCWGALSPGSRIFPRILQLTCHRLYLDSIVSFPWGGGVWGIQYPTAGPWGGQQALHGERGKQ